MRWLIAICFVIGACAPSTPGQPSASAAPVSAPSAQGGVGGIALLSIGLGNGLVLDAPRAWQVQGIGIVNRATQRQVLLSNGPIDMLPTLYGNGDVDVAALPGGAVTVEVESFCRLACTGPADETALPIDWTAAAPLYSRPLPSDRHELAVGFRWFDQPMFVVARWADGAPASDVAAIETIARSIRPEPSPPATGEYRGWHGIGPLAGIPVGTVRLVPLPAGAVIRPSGRLYDNAPYFLVRGRQHLFAFISRPLNDRCAITYHAAADLFACAIDGREFQWTRFGRYLGSEPMSDLAQHRVIVRDGAVWVRYVDDSLSSPPVLDEAAER